MADEKELDPKWVAEKTTSLQAHIIEANEAIRELWKAGCRIDVKATDAGMGSVISLSQPSAPSLRASVFIPVYGAD